MRHRAIKLHFALFQNPVTSYMRDDLRWCTLAILLPLWGWGCIQCRLRKGRRPSIRRAPVPDLHAMRNPVGFRRMKAMRRPTMRWERPKLPSMLRIAAIGCRTKRGVVAGRPPERDQTNEPVEIAPCPAAVGGSFFHRRPCRGRKPGPSFGNAGWRRPRSAVFRRRRFPA